MTGQYPKFKAAAVQTSPVFLNQKATIEKACRLMIEAAKNGAKLVAFPEAFVPGYPYWIWLDVPSENYPLFQKLFDEAVVVPSPATDELCRGAREADVHVVMGINERLSAQMGTMWNTNLLIDNRGEIVGKHRKIVPTFAEKMVWSQGDGSGLRVWETELGRIGTLACGNNTHSLYRYALIAQGEQIHVANYPAFNVPGKGDLAKWNIIRTGAHSLEGKLFNLCSTNTVDSAMVEFLCGDNGKKRKWMEGCRSYSGITDPLGNTLAEMVDQEGIVYADIDLEEIVTAKQFHDIIGHYTRMDVVSMNLCQDEDRPVWLETKGKAKSQPGDFSGDVIRELQEGQRRLSEELVKLRELIGRMERMEKV
jgi:aliphatic nitrilase